MARLSPLLLAAALLLALLSYPVAAASRRPIRRNRLQQLPTSSWTELQSELQSELDAGLDESALSHLEARAVSAKGTQCALAQPRHCDTSGAITVFVDVSIDTGMARSRPTVSRLTLQLFNATAPRTVLNFLTICEGAHRGFSYRGNRFHRIITGFMAQGGDITAGNGRGGKSIYGRTFRDETFACSHVCRGALSMANSGPDSNGSQFFLTFAPTPWLDGKHVVFGQLTDGWQTLSAMESYGSDSGQPTASISIAQCTVAPH